MVAASRTREATRPSASVLFCFLSTGNSTTAVPIPARDRKSTRLNSSHTVIYSLSLHDALPIYGGRFQNSRGDEAKRERFVLFLEYREQHDGGADSSERSEEHTSELQSHSDLLSFPTRRSSDLWWPLPELARRRGQARAFCSVS